MPEKILIVCPSNKGTIALCTLNLWKALRQYTNEEIKCVVIRKLEHGYTEFDGVEYFHTGHRRGFLPIYKQISWLRSVKRKFKPTLSIGTLFGASATNILSGGKEFKVGIFHSPHQQAKAEGRIGYAITLFYYKYLFPRLDRLYCVSNEVKRSIIESFHQISPEKVQVVYNAHDVEKIRSLAEAEMDSSEERGIFEHPTWLYIGRFDRNKAPERTLKAFADAKLPSDTQLVYIGGGNEPYELELRNLAEQLNVSNRVHFLGFKPNPYKYLAKAKALVSSSYSEGLPGVMIEALILKRPVITTNSTEGIWEIFSCDDQYDSNLTVNHITPYGIITPNSDDEGLNISYLSKAIETSQQREMIVPDSDFVNQVSFKSIAKKYLGK